MAMRLAPEEPEAGPWRVERLAVVIEALTQLGAPSAADMVISGIPRVSYDPITEIVVAPPPAAASFSPAPDR
jgi:hypothetical protein